jgi:hypothetical protein
VGVRNRLRPAQFSLALVAGMLFTVWVAALSVASGAEAGFAEPRLLPVEIDSYARDADVSPDEAERQLDIQRKGAGIVEQLQRALGNDYAGVWFDTDTGEFVVPIVRRDARLTVNVELGRVGLEENFRIQQAQFTWDELESAQARLDQSLADLIRANLIQTSRDPVRNAVVVHESVEGDEAVTRQVQAEAEKLDVAVDSRREPAKLFQSAPAACNEPVRVCDRPMRGGVKIEPLPYSGAWCSAGFKATGSGNRFMLTAGHCSKGTGAWRSRDSANAPQDLGVAEGSVFPGRDWGKLKVNGFGAFWDKEPWPTQVVHWGVNESAGISWEGWNYLGQYVCHSGATSGSSCGLVQAIGKTVNYLQGAVGNLAVVEGPSYCVMPGDSGGPVFAGSVAVGILSGGLIVPEGTCSNVGYHAEITEATTALGVSVAPRIGGPSGPTTAFQANTTDLMTIDHSGRGSNWGLGMASGTSPSIARLAGGGHQIAFQANTTDLWTVGSAGSHNWGLGMASGTSPSITGLSGGGFAVAFQANTTDLWTVSSIGNNNWKLGMAKGTSPDVVGLPGGGYQVAIQTNGGQLWTVGWAGAASFGSVIASGSSPSIASLSGGGYQIAYRGKDSMLWTTGSAGSKNWGYEMASGTSPSIAGLPGGGFQVSFQAKGSQLWTVGSAGTANWEQGLAPATSPSVTGIPGGGFQVAFQGNTGQLFTLGAVGNRNWEQGMAPGTSPDIAP